MCLVSKLVNNLEATNKIFFFHVKYIYSNNIPGKYTNVYHSYDTNKFIFWSSPMRFHINIYKPKNSDGLSIKLFYLHKQNRTTQHLKILFTYNIVETFLSSCRSNFLFGDIRFCEIS